MDDLTNTDAVEAALLRPLTSDESPFVGVLITQASSLMRIAMPTVDDRIALWTSTGKPPVGALDPDAVSAVVAGALKRYMFRSEGVASVTETDGPFAQTVAYTRDGALEGSELCILPSDVEKLSPRSFRKPGTIRLKIPEPHMGRRW